MSEKKIRACMVGMSGIALGRYPGYSLTAPAARYGPLNTEVPHSHVGAYSVLPQTDLVAVCDLKTEQFDEFRNVWGDVYPNMRFYTDYHEMLAKEEPELLSVVVSDHYHSQMVTYAAEHGVKGICCEKPMATTVDDCDKMIEACDKNGVVLSIEHTGRWMPAYQTARKAIEEGAIGKVKRLVGHLSGPRAMLFRNGTHLIDGLVYFADSEPEWVFGELDDEFADYYSYRGDGGRDPAGDPGGSGYVHFKNGVRAFINASKGQMAASFIEIIGEEGQLTLGGPSVQLKKGGYSSNSLQILPSSNHMRADIPACIHEITEVMKNGGEVSCPGREGKKTVEIIVGMLKSQESGNDRIDLPLAPGN